MTTAEAIYAELRAVAGKGFPAPPGYLKIPEKPLGYENESKLHELRVMPPVTGIFADVAREAEARNIPFMPYEESIPFMPYEESIPLRFYAHPISKREED